MFKKAPVRHKLKIFFPRPISAAATNRQEFRGTVGCFIVHKNLRLNCTHSSFTLPARWDDQYDLVTTLNYCKASIKKRTLYVTWSSLFSGQLPVMPWPNEETKTKSYCPAWDPNSRPQICNANYWAIETVDKNKNNRQLIQLW